jgi:hypothetical protein
MPTLILLEARKGRVVKLDAREDIFTGMKAAETMEKWIAMRNEKFPEFVAKEEEEAPKPSGPPE